MSLPASARLGPYEILSPLGAGGMGEVYRAKDTKLGRDVALKILPASFTSDPERVARFRREAQVLASLNHPHIAQIHGMEEANGTQFLVLELVDGESLDKRIARGPIPVDEALGIAKEIAEALEAAHEKGIVHRDLKPANIALTKDGQVKVLDFGLAKAVDATSSGSIDGMNSPTITSPVMMTGVGVILGTAAYMSPEQAKGRAADKRSDIWAFGCVLYEMLTGKRSFDGEDVSDTLAAVLRGEPDWTRLPAQLPLAIRVVVERCLKKDRRQRMGDLSTALLLFTESDLLVIRASPSARFVRERLMWLGTVTIIVAIFGLWALRRSSSGAASPSVLRFSMGLQPAESLLGSPNTNSGGRPTRTAFAWAPDGRTVVFGGMRAGVQQLYVRHLDQLEAQPLPGTVGAIAPFFSPDGRWVGFWANGELKKVPVLGGPAVTITKSALISRATWGEGDRVFFDQDGGLAPGSIWRVSAGGGRAEVVATADRAKGEYSYRLPQLLPGGKALLFTMTRTVGVLDDAQIVVRSLETGRQQAVTDGADARYVPPGYLVFLRLGTLLAAPFDATRTALTGEAVGLLDGVMQSAHATTAPFDAGAGQFSVSPGGSLAYVSGGTFSDDLRSLVWVDRNGSMTPIAAPPRSYWAPRLTSDGQRLAVYSRGAEGRIWIHDLRTATTTALTDRGGDSVFPVWTTDNTHVIYAAGVPPNLFWRVADGSGASERLTTSPAEQRPNAFSPDGERLAYVQSDPTTGARIWMLTLHNGQAKASPWHDTRSRELYPAWSPDGHWLAFISDESGRYEVYIQPFPGPGPRYPVSRDGGLSPAWSRDGREIFFLVGAEPPRQMAMMTAPVTVSPNVSVGAPRKLFEGAFWVSSGAQAYDVTPDGRRFVMVRGEEHPATSPTEIMIVENWLEELKARVPTK
jgi:serine/threonine-protein kinase